jgi:hypothetical protein
VGKWTAFRSKLPKLELEPSYLEKVNASKLRLLGATSGEDANVNRLASLYAERKWRKDDLEAEISAINTDLEALSQLLVDRFEAEQQQSVQLNNGATVYLKDTVYPTVTNKEELMAWIKKNKMEAVLSVHHKTLQGITSERLQDGKAAPPGVSCFLKTSAAVRRSGRNESDE